MLRELKSFSLETTLATAIGTFVIYTAATGPFVLLVNRSVFLGLVLLMGLTIYPLFKGTKYRPLGVLVDLTMAGFIVAACARVAIYQDEIMMTLPIASNSDMLLCWGLVFSVLELCRRSVGWMFTSIVAAGVLYALFGQYAPGTFETRGFSLQFITETLYLGDLGVWGSLVGISSTVLAAFIMFGSLLLFSGAGQTFIDMATRIGGATPGGAAKVATIASGMFGMLAGSSVANVATTGNITIPMMKRLKYPPALSGAIEAVASTGGQLAPPILGAAAFVMAEFVGVGYWTIAAAAIIPALLYYLGVYWTVHVIAVRTDLGKVAADEMPAWKTAFAPKRVLPLALGLGGIAFGVVNGNSIVFAVFIGMCGLVAGYLTTRLRDIESAKSIGKNLFDGFIDAGKGLVMVGILLAGAQILVGLINLTGLAGTISALVVQLAGPHLLLLGVVTACIGLLMGMGLPTIAAYVLVAAMMIGPLENAGVPNLSAHMFVLYYAALSAITPPVCVAVFIAAGIARTDWGPVALQALRLGAITYILPLMFLYYPALLGQGTWEEIGWAALTGVTLTFAVASLLSGLAVLGNRIVDSAILLVIILLAIYDHRIATSAAAGIMAVTLYASRRRRIVSQENEVTALTDANIANAKSE